MFCLVDLIYKWKIKWPNAVRSHFVMWQIQVILGISTDLITISAFADPVENGGYDELDDATENKQHTHEHPDVQEGDIGHSRDILTDLMKEKNLVDRICFFECTYQLIEKHILVVKRRLKSYEKIKQEAKSVGKQQSSRKHQ